MVSFLKLKKPVMFPEIITFFTGNPHGFTAVLSCSVSSCLVLIKKLEKNVLKKQILTKPFQPSGACCAKRGKGTE